MSLELLTVLLLILAAEFVNGWTDAPNAIATVAAGTITATSALGIMFQSSALKHAIGLREGRRAFGHCNPDTR